MAQAATQQAAPKGNERRYVLGTGVSDNDIVVEALDIREYDTFELMSTAGAMDVFVSLDGDNYASAARSLADLGAEDGLPVTVTSANRTYGFRGGPFHIRIRQNGVTAVANACLVCKRLGG